jgi:hypothetical protein
VTVPKLQTAHAPSVLVSVGALLAVLVLYHFIHKH